MDRIVIPFTTKLEEIQWERLTVMSHGVTYIQATGAVMEHTQLRFWPVELPILPPSFRR